LGPWSQHGSQTGGYFKCNIYDPSKHDQAGKLDSADFGKWMHHLERYEHHVNAIQNAKEHKLPQIKTLSERYEELHPGWSGTFILEALDVLLECRELLAHTYVASFSLPDDYPDRPLYEFLQGNLELQADRLNTLLSEFQADSQDSSHFLALKSAVIATRHNLSRMAEAIQRGLSRDFAAVIHAPASSSATPSKTDRWDWFGFLRK
jgi:ariadne-1